VITCAFGDNELGQSVVTSVPYVFSTPYNPGTDKWLVLGSDGLWDGVEPDRVMQLLATATDAQRVAEELVKMAKKGCGDNITVIVVDLEERESGVNEKTEL